MPERAVQALLDTSVVVDRDVVDAARLPARVGICAVALAEGTPLITRNAADLAGLDGLVDVIEV